MNCKQGDLAVIVRSAAGNEGKIVRCLKLLPHHAWKARDGSIHTAPSWQTDALLVGWGGDVSGMVKDSQLRPIRDPGDDAVDEMVLLAGLPQEVTA